jgi:hypothetical protein
MCVDSDLFDVEKWTTREFSISCDVVSKSEGYKCRITIVLELHMRKENMAL